MAEFVGYFQCLMLCIALQRIFCTYNFSFRNFSLFNISSQEYSCWVKKWLWLINMFPFCTPVCGLGWFHHMANVYFVDRKLVTDQLDHYPLLVIFLSSPWLPWWPHQGDSAVGIVFFSENLLGKQSSFSFWRTVLSSWILI